MTVHGLNTAVLLIVAWMVGLYATRWTLREPRARDGLMAGVGGAAAMYAVTVAVLFTVATVHALVTDTIYWHWEDPPAVARTGDVTPDSSSPIIVRDRDERR